MACIRGWAGGRGVEGGGGGWEGGGGWRGWMEGGGGWRGQVGSRRQVNPTIKRQTAVECVQ